MGSNSIRSNLDKNAIITSIRMMLSTPKSSYDICVIVEGDDDISFWKGRFKDNVDIYESFSGKEGVEFIVDHFDNDRVIGICDADYAPKNHNHVIYYDYSSLEVMMVMSDLAFDAIWREFYNGPKAGGILRCQIFNDLKWISAFRKLNYANGWGIKFEGLSFYNLYDPNTDSINTSKSIECIKQSNLTVDFVQTKIIDQVEMEMNSMNNEQSVINAQGHDVIRYFQCLCNHTLPRSARHFNEDTIVHSLKCAFSNKELQETELFSALFTYENSHGYSILDIL